MRNAIEFMNHLWNIMYAMYTMLSYRCVSSGRPMELRELQLVFKINQSKVNGNRWFATCCSRKKIDGNEAQLIVRNEG